MFTGDSQSERVFGGVFLIGLAILFWTGGLFPGILFVAALAMMARSVSEGRGLTENKGAIGLLLLWAIFAFGGVFSFLSFNWWPLLLIALGLYLLYGQRGQSRGSSTSPRYEGKGKNDDLV